MNNKTLFVLLVSALLLPRYILADAPPPPPFLVNFTYEGQKITDEKFYAVVLECGNEKNSNISTIPQLNISQPNNDGKCNWLPRLLPYTDHCANSQCNFNWILGNFKLAVYIPSLDKTFVSDALTREYLGYYGHKTQTVYDVDLLQDNSVVVTNMFVEPSFIDDVIGGTFLWLLILSFIATIILESIVVLVFFLLKKVPKRIFLALLIGNLISVPFVWVAVSAFPILGTLYVAEIIAMIFEVWLIRISSKKILSWKTSLLISLIMNIFSFFAGPYLIFFSHLL